MRSCRTWPLRRRPPGYVQLLLILSCTSLEWRIGHDPRAEPHGVRTAAGPCRGRPRAGGEAATARGPVTAIRPGRSEARAECSTDAVPQLNMQPRRVLGARTGVTLPPGVGRGVPQ